MPPADLIALPLMYSSGSMTMSHDAIASTLILPRVDIYQIYVEHLLSGRQYGERLLYHHFVIGSCIISSLVRYRRSSSDSISMISTLDEYDDDSTSRYDELSISSGL